MKIQVIKAFNDKHTGKGYNKGRMFESDDLERIIKLQSAGYLKRVPLKIKNPVKPVVEKPEVKPAEKPPVDMCITTLIVEPKPKPKYLGGGWYQLPGGRKVRKKDLPGGDE